MTTPIIIGSVENAELSFTWENVRLFGFLERIMKTNEFKANVAKPMRRYRGVVKVTYVTDAGLNYECNVAITPGGAGKVFATPASIERMAIAEFKKITIS